MKLNILKTMLLALPALLVFGCAEIEPKPIEPSPGHIQSEQIPAGEIPALVRETPLLPAPEPPQELEKYTVVVNEVPVKELLFALARDAKINVDIDPRIDGVATINAVDQTLPQILERIARQVDMRYEYHGDNLYIQPDEPYFRTYKVDYLNIARDTTNTNSVATSLATTGIDVGDSGGGGSSEGAFAGNNSTTEVTSRSPNDFFNSIARNIQAILGEDIAATGGGQSQVSNNVIPSPGTGVISVIATSRQHRLVQEFLDQVQATVRRQVMIQVSIVEVTLSDDYQAGIDWQTILGNFSIDVETIGTPLAVSSGAGGLELLFNTTDTAATIRALDEFGDVRVLSSPQLMALNNQTAILKRVENRVFFTIESDTVTGGQTASQSFDTTVHNLPIGIVMTITPFISEADEVMLLVRPTISRDTGVNKQIPVPNNVAAGVDLSNNFVPETISQEMESLIRLSSGQTAVLGGLMIDNANRRQTGVPGFSRLPLLGNLFKTTEILQEKTELVIFIRPIVVRNPSVDGDLQLYKTFLDRPSATGTTSP